MNPKIKQKSSTNILNLLHAFTTSNYLLSYYRFDDFKIKTAEKMPPAKKEHAKAEYFERIDFSAISDESKLNSFPSF